MKASDYYNHYWSHDGHNPRDVSLPTTVRRILDKYVEAHSRCLDFGCGTGEKVKSWVDQAALDYVGVDVSATAIEEANAKGLVAHTIADAKELPFEDAEFDCAVSFEVMEHLFDPSGVMRELHRVIRPGGMVVVTVPNTAFIIKRMQLLTGTWNPGGDRYSIEQPWRDPHIRFFTSSTLNAMLIEAGFEITEFGGHQDYFRATSVSIKGRVGNTRLFRQLEQRLPSLFSKRLYVVGRRVT